MNILEFTYFLLMVVKNKILFYKYPQTFFIIYVNTLNLKKKIPPISA